MTDVGKAVELKMALDKKYRPKTLDEMVGNKELITTIKSIVERSTGIPSSMLLSGPSGCGKTTLARIIANMLCGTSSTTKEYNISNMTGVDTARKIIEHTGFLPFGGSKKIYILNEVHKASNSFQNCMLETLEEPPSYVHFILCTTEPQSLLRTILNRCTKFQVKPLRARELVSLISNVCRKEEAEIDISTITKIAQASSGSPRQALVLLDSVINCKPNEREECIAQFSFDAASTITLCQMLLDKKDWTEVVPVLLNLESEPEDTRLGILGYMEKVLLSKSKPGPKQFRAWEITTALASERIYYRPQLIAKCFELISV